MIRNLCRRLALIGPGAFLTAALAGALTSAAGPARAEWLVAESPRFIVYSEGGERTLRTYVQKLESYDRALRLQLNLNLDAAPGRKLPIYLLSDSADLEMVRPGINRSVQGFYLATDEDVFAVARSTEIGDAVLLHEYAHHFMMQNASSGYPSWFVEGFAEYYMTADIEADRVSIGRSDENRIHWLLNSPWIRLSEMLGKRPFEVSSVQRMTYYPMAWLLTHWFLSDDTRREQLAAYLVKVKNGGDPVSSMEEATGMPLNRLEQELDRHLRRRLPYYRINAEFPEAPVAVRRLDAVTGDLLLLNQRLKTSREEAEQTLALARRLSGPAAQSSMGRLIRGHAELHFGDADQGEALLKALVADEPTHVEALQFLASRRLKQARETPSEATPLIAEAKAWLDQARAVDPGDYRTLMLSAQTGQFSPDYPTQKDLDTWILAYRAAPQLDEIRVQAAQALMHRGRNREAIFLLEPVAGDPHGGSGAAYARRLIDQANGGPPAGAPEPETAPAD